MTITKGTSKQIEWAESIKADVMRRVDAHLDRMTAKVSNADLAAKQSQMIRDWFEARDDASWWIDNCRDAEGLPSTTIVVNLVQQAAADLMAK